MRLASAEQLSHQRLHVTNIRENVYRRLEGGARRVRLGDAFPGIAQAGSVFYFRQQDLTEAVQHHLEIKQALAERTARK
jgi:hypothetical protein